MPGKNGTVFVTEADPGSVVAANAAQRSDTSVLLFVGDAGDAIYCGAALQAGGRSQWRAGCISAGSGGAQVIRVGAFHRALAVGAQVVDATALDLAAVGVGGTITCARDAEQFRAGSIKIAPGASHSVAERERSAGALTGEAASHACAVASARGGHHGNVVAAAVADIPEIGLIAVERGLEQRSAVGAVGNSQRRIGTLQLPGYAALAGLAVQAITALAAGGGGTSGAPPKPATPALRHAQSRALFGINFPRRIGNRRHGSVLARSALAKAKTRSAVAGVTDSARARAAAFA